MKYFLLSGVCLLSFMAIAADASAGQERWPRWYAGLNGSLTFVDDADISSAATGEMQFDTGWGLGASLGYEPAFTDMFLGNARIEMEYLYQENDLDGATVGGVSAAENGQLTTQALMLNGFYDFRTDARLTPYIGAGVGWANTELDRLASVTTTDDEDEAFAWQLMAGLGYAPSSLPNTVWSVGYRYFTTADLEYAVSGGGAIELEHEAHRVDVGARFRF